VLDLYSPSSFPTLVRSSRLLLGDDPRITPDKKAFLRKQLEFERVEALSKFTADQEVAQIMPWRTLLQRLFERARGGG
jgi:hypothetical protein